MNVSRNCQLLQRQLERIRINNAAYKKFVPEKELHKLIGREIILKIVEEISQPHQVQELVDFILKGGQKVFGILVLISHVTYIKHFVRSDQLQMRPIDDLLPFKRSRLQEILDDDYASTLFFERQWEFSIPVFSGRIIPRILEGQTILPYLIDAPLTDGGFGSVYKIKIHPSHQPDGYEPIAMFVRKELKLHDLTYENEVRTMSTLQRLKHPHILRLVGCYTFNSKHNLISPYVPDGTLKSYVEKPKCANFCKEELLYSISGLASAVWALHEFVSEDTAPFLKGHHQDLRPENILVCGSRLILADFGLSSLKPIHEDSRTPFKGRRGYCQAPECFELRNPYSEYEVTRKSDIYALACIITDLLVYSEKGPGGVKKFRKDREFQRSRVRYALYHQGDSANPAVIARLENLVFEDGSRSLRDTVDLVFQMLKILPEERPEAATVTARLCINTIEAFSERFRVLFAQFPFSPDAFFEKARFSSWAMSQDVELYSCSSDATTTGKNFDSTVDILRQMRKALESIDKGDPNLDCRSFIEVRTLNTQLLNTLSSERKSRARSTLKTIVLENLRTDGQNEIFTAIRDALGDSSLGRGAETQHLVARMEDSSASFPTPEVSLFKGSVRHVQSIGPCHLAELQDEQNNHNKLVIVETVQYQDQLRRERLLQRVQALCQLLSSKRLGQELRTLKFYGLRDNDEAFCFEIIYEIPEEHRAQKLQLMPVSLRELLIEREPCDYPSRETRLRLSLELTESLAAFHDVAWFHKDLTSFNVLFFPTDQTARRARAAHPYLFGFQHSRSAVDDFTEGPLQDRSHQRYHPSYISLESRQRTGFCPQFDWYSLGILLIEIGLWKTIDEFMREHARQDNYAFSEILIQQKVSALSFQMGDEYEHIVQECLTGLKETPKSTEEIRQRALETNLLLKNKVVIPLQSLDRLQTAQELIKKRKRDTEDEIAHRPTHRKKSL